MSNYPTQFSDLTEEMPEATNLYQRSRDVRMTSLYRCGYDDVQVARVLRTDLATVDCLHDGTLDTTTTALGVVKALPSIAMNAPVRKLVRAYSQLIAFCEQAPARDVPQPINESLAHMDLGTADADVVRNLRQGLRGYMKSNAGRNLATVWRQRALSESGVSVASLAAALEMDAETCFRWVAGLDSPPVTDLSERYYRALAYLAEGPSVETVQSQSGRTSAVY